MSLCKIPKIALWLLANLWWWPSSLALAGQNDHPWLGWLGLGQAPQSTISPANALSREVDVLYGLFGWVMLAILVVVSLLFTFILVRYRRSKNPQATEIHGSSKLEITWTLVPVVILIFLAWPTLHLVFKTARLPDLKANQVFQVAYPGEADPAKTNQSFDRYLEIRAVGHQWWWEFEYLNLHQVDPSGSAPQITALNRVTANELWLPVGVPVLLHLSSEDVIHSFWVPRLAGKLDVVPGAKNQMSLIVEEPGRYAGQCAEYCGASHAVMRFSIVGVTQEQFNGWLAWGQGSLQVKSPEAAQGMALFATCLACHTIQGMRPFEPRDQRLAQALAQYQEESQAYQMALGDLAQKLKSQGKPAQGAALLSHPEAPSPPLRPRLFQDSLRTLAPDLTDLRFRKSLLSGIKPNNKEVLKAWIKNPKKLKPEIENTLVTRMPGFGSVFDDQQLDQLVEFLLNLQYDGSPEPEILNLRGGFDG